eukprot:s258_g20.t1
MGAVRRWQLAEAQHQTLSRRLEQTVPGVEFHAYQLGALGVVVAAVFLAVGLLNTIVGLFELLAWPLESFWQLYLGHWARGKEPT